MRLRNPFVMESGVFVTNYQDDLALHYSLVARIRLYAFIALLFALPLFMSAYAISVANLVAIAVIAALGLNILTGFTGQISIGHGAFVGVGAYTSAYLTTQLGVSFWLALPAAGLVTAAVGSVFGIPSLRLKGLYLAIATLAAQVIIEFAMIHWTSVTKGSQGMFLQRPSLGSFVLDGDRSFFYLLLTLAIAATAFAFNLFRTRPGRAFVAIRDRDLAAEVIGVNLFKYKILAFAISSFYAGIAGSLWAHYLQIISPEHFTITASIEYLAMVIIGGLGSVMGSIYGAVFMTLLPIVLRSVADAASGVFPNIEGFFNALREVIFGLTIILFLVFEPRGLAKLWQNVKDYFKLWPFSY